jgi:trigger factor
MFDYKIKKLPKSSVEILVSIPKETIKEEYQKSFDRLQKELQVEGFRKGKVPTNIAKKHLSSQTVYQQVIQHLLPQIYEQVIKTENLTPIANPKIDLVKAKENEDWEIKILIAEKPIIDIKNYKEVVKKAKADFKKDDIWVPGKDATKSSPSETAENEEKKEKVLNQILSELLKQIKFEIADLIIEEELNKRLSQLVDDVQKIGLTVDNYLKTKNLTLEQLKEKYSEEILNTYKLEFILQAIADLENINVEKEDLDKLFANIKDEKEKEQARQNAYFYASILRKQKTLDLLLNL